jgi:hypothetical protein
VSLINVDWPPESAAEIIVGSTCFLKVDLSALDKSKDSH